MQLTCRTVQILGIVRAWSNCIVSPVPCQKLWKITYHWSNQVIHCLILLITRNECTVVPLLNNTKCHAITFIPCTRGSFFSHTWSKSARGLFCLTGASGSYIDKKEQPEPWLSLNFQVHWTLVDSNMLTECWGFYHGYNFSLNCLCILHCTSLLLMLFEKKSWSDPQRQHWHLKNHITIK